MCSAAAAAPADEAACCLLRVDVPGTQLQLEFRLRSDECCAALYAAVHVQLLQRAMNDDDEHGGALQELVRARDDAALRLPACS
jgi:hypothetical protein